MVLIHKAIPALLLAAVAWAQQSLPVSRTGSIIAEREARAANPPPEHVDRLEAAVGRIQNSGILQQIVTGANGFGLRLGGLPAGGGFALGPAFSKPALWNENAAFKLSAAGSIRRFYGIDAVFSLPRLAGRRIRMDFVASHNDSPQIPYYGPGSDSRKEGRTNFRRENTTVSALFGARVHPRHLTAGITAGKQFINVGPGTDRRYASADATYTPQQAPGIHEQADYVSVGPFIHIDFRDRKNDPHRGVNFVTRYLYMNDSLDRYAFRRVESVFEGYVPFLNEKRVFAFRARADLSYVDSKNQVPFYMQPTLGGSDDLRGFRPFRFYGDNALLLNAEYRWEVAPALDMAVFADAGRVFRRPGDIGFSELEKAGGLGLRFKNRDAVVVRIDTGFSREGFQVWFTFDPPFTGLFHNLF